VAKGGCTKGVAEYEAGCQGGCAVSEPDPEDERSQLVLKFLLRSDSDSEGAFDVLGGCWGGGVGGP